MVVGSHYCEVLIVLLKLVVLCCAFNVGKVDEPSRLTLFLPCSTFCLEGTINGNAYMWLLWYPRQKASFQLEFHLVLMIYLWFNIGLILLLKYC